MKPWSLLAALVAAGLTTSSCESAQECDLDGCEDGVNITVANMLATIGTDLPVTVQACVGAACTSFQLAKTGATPACTQLDAQNALCSFDGQGTLVLTSVPLPAGAEAGAMLAVHVTVTDKNDASLFDGTQMVPVTALTQGSGSCGTTCDRAVASFTSS